jgi:hypothetical protein
VVAAWVHRREMHSIGTSPSSIVLCANLGGRGRCNVESKGEWSGQNQARENWRWGFTLEITMEKSGISQWLGPRESLGWERSLGGSREDSSRDKLGEYLGSGLGGQKAVGVGVGLETLGGVGAYWLLRLRGCPIGAAQDPSLSALTLQVGITLHYSSLSTLLWMGVKARVLHKELTWRAPPLQEGDPAPPAPRPMLRYILPAVSFAIGEGLGGRCSQAPRVDLSRVGTRSPGDHSPKTEAASLVHRLWSGYICRFFRHNKASKGGVPSLPCILAENLSGLLTSAPFRVRESNYVLCPFKQSWPSSRGT